MREGNHKHFIILQYLQGDLDFMGIYSAYLFSGVQQLLKIAYVL